MMKIAGLRTEIWTGIRNAIASLLLTGVLAGLPSATFIVFSAHVHTAVSASSNVLFPNTVIIGLLPLSMWSVSEFSVVCFYSGERSAIMFAVTPFISSWHLYLLLITLWRHYETAFIEKEELHVEKPQGNTNAVILLLKGLSAVCAWYLCVPCTVIWDLLWL